MLQRKAHIYLKNGMWFCDYMAFTGVGDTPLEAYMRAWRLWHE